MRANPQTHAGLTLPDKTWVLLDKLADAGVGGVDKGIAAGTVGRDDEERLWRLEEWFSQAPQRKWLRFTKGDRARSRKQWRIYDELLVDLHEQEETLTLDDLVEMFSFPSWDDISDRNYDAWLEACPGGEDDDACVEALERDAYNSWRSGVVHIAEDLFRQHSLALRDTVDEWRFIVAPTTERNEGEPDWETAARDIIHTLNGMGPFRLDDIEAFVEMGPFSGLREAVLRSLGAIADWPKVYAGRTARRMYEDYTR